jgi:hypothetical protein
VANGSQRDKERDVDPVFSAQAEDLRRVDLFGVALRIVGRHCIEALAQCADKAFVSGGIECT